MITPAELENRAELSAEHRRLIVRELAAALVEAWRRKHQPLTSIDRCDGEVNETRAADRDSQP